MQAGWSGRGDAEKPKESGFGRQLHQDVVMKGKHYGLANALATCNLFHIVTSTIADIDP